ncbi:glucokinase [Neorhodopirellula lusitana]|uniref:Glucokinase n=1 Tax=Neorhodopirellula lusitana TaxID=445327 RepID=A0ABY1PVF1_9BACT|nr:ROK family protein [Neorhodopirellula lusitana]SMP48390.1 glucokinase [Neorhodopirellula lusitana]
MTSRPASSSPSVAPYYWGIDIGGTSIKCGLVDHHGQTIEYETVPTLESEGPEAAVNRIAQVVAEAETRHGVVGQVRRIGLGAPGPMDLPRGYFVAPPQLPSWWDFPICDAIKAKTGREISFLNDANAAAYGEFWIGSGAKQTSMVLLTLGTGVGGGVIVESELINGVNSFGSECGHILVDPSPDAQICGWGGGRGHLEAYASASGVTIRTRKKLRDHAESSLYGLLSEPENHLTSKRVYDAAVAGDEFALSMIDDTARWLGVGVATLVHVIDPGSVVLGGAMNFGGADCPIGQRFLAGIREEFRTRTFPNVFEGTELSFATLGGDAGYLGAAGYAQKQDQDLSNTDLN